jgi:hypothetical protein
MLDKDISETKPDGNNVTLEDQLLKMGQIQADFTAMTGLYRKQGKSPGCRDFSDFPRESRPAGVGRSLGRAKPRFGVYFVYFGAAYSRAFSEIGAGMSVPASPPHAA